MSFNYIEKTDDGILKAVIETCKQLRDIKQQYNSGKMPAKELETKNDEMYSLIDSLHVLIQDIQK